MANSVPVGWSSSRTAEITPTMPTITTRAAAAARTGTGTRTLDHRRPVGAACDAWAGRDDGRSNGGRGVDGTAVSAMAGGGDDAPAPGPTPAPAPTGTGAPG